ncbi:MAG: hypothetical protein WC231_02180 [Dehalococcoidales bacterium]|jgi:hypothetical protein|nr:hypothetical protein [Dehalococcoidales bacterium]MDD5605069.1 hypothetical protein [Dehalococcoidales bacterium]MDX9985921.1 hypothetical protein [Dehalococcoidales bacterium]
MDFIKEKLLNKTAITGISAIILSSASFIAQFMLEGWEMVISQWLSPMGIASIILFLLGSVLIIWNTFRRELTFEQKGEIVADREIYLPQLVLTVDSLSNRKEELAENQ